MSSDISGQGQEATVYSTVGPAVSRRGFMRAAAGAGAAGAVGVGSTRTRLSPVGNSQAALPAGVIAAGAIAVYAGAQIAQDYFADDEDLSGYVGSDNLWSRIEEKAIDLQIANEQVLSSLENTAAFADRVALHEGMQAVIEAFEDDVSQSEAQEAMEEAIDEHYYAEIQRDFLDAWDYSVQQIQSWHDAVEAFEPEGDDEDINKNNLFHVFINVDKDNYDENLEDADFGQRDYSTHAVPWNASDEDSDDQYQIDLVDGTTRETYRATTGTHGDFSVIKDDESSILPYVVKNDEREDASNDYTFVTEESQLVRAVNPIRFQVLWDQIIDSRDRVYSELSGFVSEVYDHYDDPSEIDTSDLLTPTMLYESASEEDDSAFQDAALRSLGIPRSGDRLDIYLHESDTTVEGAIYVLDDELSLEVGQEYDPNETDEEAETYVSDSPTYLSYVYMAEDEETGELDEEAEVVLLDEPFTVESAEDSDGESVESVDFDEGPTYDPSDIESLMDQLAQQQELLIEMQQEADSGGGGGGWFDFGGSGGGIAAVALGAVALIIAVLNSNN